MKNLAFFALSILLLSSFVLSGNTGCASSSGDGDSGGTDMSGASTPTGVSYEAAAGDSTLGPGGPGLPPEAIEACNGNAAGEVCEITTPNGDALIGICVAEGESVACRPDGPPPGGLPPEAIEACSGKSTGDACGVVIPNGDALTGFCVTGGETVACRPNGPPPGGPAR